MRLVFCYPTAAQAGLLLVATLVVIFVTGQHFWAPHSAVEYGQQPRGSIFSDLSYGRMFSTYEVNELSGSELPRIKPYACVRTRELTEKKLNYVMCVKPLARDTVISASFVNAGMWETHEVEVMLFLTSLYPNATFLDLGSNIGTFSVAVAATNYKVVSVDPFDENLAYIRMSTFLFETDHNVRYIQNTVSDEKMTMYGILIPDNEGAIHFLPEEEAKKRPVEQMTSKGVTSTRFQNILAVIPAETVIIKMDIEGYECKALTSYLEDLTQQKKFIPYIMMEWFYVSQNIHDCCPPAELNRFIQGFLKSGYQPISVENFVYAKLEEQGAWNNILWAHKDAIQTFVKT